MRILCIETVNYSIYRNNIQVLVTHEFQNESPVTVQMYYGMQSMFDKETHTLTANGKYVDWTVQRMFLPLQRKSIRHFAVSLRKAQMCINLLICLPMDWEIMKKYQMMILYS